MFFYLTIYLIFCIFFSFFSISLFPQCLFLVCQILPSPFSSTLASCLSDTPITFFLNTCFLFVTYSHHLFPQHSFAHYLLTHRLFMSFACWAYLCCLLVICYLLISQFKHGHLDFPFSFDICIILFYFVSFGTH